MPAVYINHISTFCSDIGQICIFSTVMTGTSEKVENSRIKSYCIGAAVNIHLHISAIRCRQKRIRRSLN